MRSWKPLFLVAIASFSLSSFAYGDTPVNPMQQVKPEHRGTTDGCTSLGCHDGIERISPTKMNFQCTECHKGNDDTVDKITAHTGMFANPADFRVVDQTCGSCHSNIVENSKKSLHATMGGMIGGTRWTWGAQDSKNAVYATYDISDDDGDVPIGALPALAKIPQYDPDQAESQTNSPADDYLRNQCLRCHLWSGGHERDGDWRASGCAACHMVYSDDGLYAGSDPTIDPSEKGHPIKHEITTKIPEFQCIHCHNRGGRTGVSFIGTIESDGYGSPWTDTGGKQPQLHGKYYNHLTPDVHFERGMTCIDCHTMQDLHGDGNIYSKKELAVEIECVDCHGTVNAESNLLTSWGNPLRNLKRLSDGTVVLTSKLDAAAHVVPQVMSIALSDDGQAAMRRVTRHLEKLECYACHNRWAPQCYGCHAKQDLRITGRDWIDPVPDLDDPSRTALKAAADASQIAKGWEETRSYLRWETPVLGVNADSEGNKVAPTIPGCQVFFTQIGTSGVATVHNRVYTASDGFSGLAHNPIQSHTVSDRPRPCATCHNSSKAQGMGTGTYDALANLLGIGFELEQTVDQNGNPIQTTSHGGARPLNAVEMETIGMDQTCVLCHTNGIP